MTTFRNNISPKGCIDIKAVAKMLGIGVTSEWRSLRRCLASPKEGQKSVLGKRGGTSRGRNGA